MFPYFFFISQACHSAALSSASDAAAREKGKAVEDARSKVTKLWGADQVAHKEKVKELEDKLSLPPRATEGDEGP